MLLLAIAVILLDCAAPVRASAGPTTQAQPASQADVGGEEAGDEGVHREPYRVPETVALRSLVIPGWGQRVNGQSGKGWFLTGLAVFGVLLGTEVLRLDLLTGGRTEHNLERDLGWFLYAGSVAWGTVDGYIVAQRLNRENGYDLTGGLTPPDPPGARLTLVRISF